MSVQPRGFHVFPEVFCIHSIQKTLLAEPVACTQSIYLLSFFALSFVIAVKYFWTLHQL